MNDADDRLAGDLVWELFPVQPTGKRSARHLHALEVSLVVVLTWFLYQPLSVGIACLAISLKDFREGWRLASSIPDKAGARICSLFAYSWSAWKLGAAGFASMFAAIFLSGSIKPDKDITPALVLAMLFWVLGFLASAALAAVGLAKAFQSGMRIWIGEGINQARTLLLGMLVVGFTLIVLMPAFLLAPGVFPRPAGQPGSPFLAMSVFFGCMFGGPVVILILLDYLAKRIVADQPGKFGPKVPAVGKWDK